MLRKGDRGGRGRFQSGVGDGDGCRIGFLPLKSSTVEQNSQIPKDLLGEFDPAPKLCSRSTTGKRAFQLRRRVSPSVLNSPPKSLCFAAREKARIAILFRRAVERGNISMKITWRSNAQEMQGS